MSCKSITTTILKMPHFLINFILILQPNIPYWNGHPHASYNVKLFNWVIVYRPQHNILLNNSNSLERQDNFPFWKRATRTAGSLFSSSVLCKDKLDSVLIRVKEEVQKYVNHVLQSQHYIAATSLCLDPDGILQKVNQGGQRITAVQGTASQELQKPPVAFPADRLETAQKSWATWSCRSPPLHRGDRGWQLFIRPNPVLRPLKTNPCRTGQIQLNIACKDSKAYFSVRVLVFWQIEVVDRDCVLPAATIQECCLALEGSFSFVVVVVVF